LRDKFLIGAYRRIGCLFSCENLLNLGRVRRSLPACSSQGIVKSQIHLVVGNFLRLIGEPLFLGGSG